MAKKSSIVKNIRRQKIVEKFSIKRKEFKKIIKDPKTSLEEGLKKTVQWFESAKSNKI